MEGLKHPSLWFSLPLVLGLAILGGVWLWQGTADEAPPLRMGVIEWPPYSLLHYAQETGVLDPDEVELVEFDQPVQALTAYHSDAVDLVALTSLHMAQIERDVPGHIIVLVVSESLGADALIARPGIRSIEDLVGARLGIAPEALGSYVATRALATAGLTLDDVSLTRAGLNQLEDLFLAGELDAIVTSEPWATRALKVEGATLLFDSSEIPGEIYDLIIARDEVVMARAETLDSLRRGWGRALELYREDPDTVAAAIAWRSGLTPQALRRVLDRALHLKDLDENRRLLLGEDGSLMDALRALDLAQPTALTRGPSMGAQVDGVRDEPR